MAKNIETEIEEPKKAKKEVKTGLYTEDSYTFALPLSAEKQDDVTVGINGRFTKIKRGVEVTVSAPVYEVLKNMERMDNLAITRSNELQSK